MTRARNVQRGKNDLEMTLPKNCILAPCAFGMWTGKSRYEQCVISKRSQLAARSAWVFFVAKRVVRSLA